MVYYRILNIVSYLHRTLFIHPVCTSSHLLIQPLNPSPPLIHHFRIWNIHFLELLWELNLNSAQAPGTVTSCRLLIPFIQVAFLWDHGKHKRSFLLLLETMPRILLFINDFCIVLWNFTYMEAVCLALLKWLVICFLLVNIFYIVNLYTYNYWCTYMSMYGLFFSTGLKTLYSMKCRNPTMFWVLCRHLPHPLRTKTIPFPPENSLCLLPSHSLTALHSLKPLLWLFSIMELVCLF